jgi:hypothetical protein
MLDLDLFKRFNDTHGHLAGDRLLRSAVAAWSECLRPTDVLARYGGEEFLVLLPACGAGEAFEIVEHLRAATPEGKTCSAGIGVWDGSADSFLGRADTQLYLAKSRGRDRTELARAKRPSEPSRAPDAARRSGSGEQALVGDRLSADRTSARIGGVQALGGVTQLGELRLGSGDERGDLRAFERDRRSFGVVLVVAHRVGGGAHDVIVIPPKRSEPCGCPLPVLADATAELDALLGCQAGHAPDGAPCGWIPQLRPHQVDDERGG